MSVSRETWKREKREAVEYEKRVWISMWINFWDRNSCAPRNYVNPCILLGFFVLTKSKYIDNLGMAK